MDTAAPRVSGSCADQLDKSQDESHALRIVTVANDHYTRPSVGHAILDGVGTRHEREWPFAHDVSSPDPLLVDRREAARLLGISVEALDKRVQRSQLPPGALKRTGRRLQFVRAKLLDARGGAR